MDRREFVGSLIAATMTTNSNQPDEQQTSDSISLSLPDLGENWSDYEAFSSESGSRYDWNGVLAERADLRESTSQYAADAPGLFSYFAARASFPDNLRSQEPGTSIDISGGGGLLPFSLRIDNLGELIQSQTCGLDPHPSEVRTSSQSLFTDKVGGQHLIEGDPDIANGLRRDISPACANTREYSKGQYLDYQYTIESTWEADDGDELEDIDFKGYLSIEYANDEYLLVGGMIPDESVSTGVLGEEIVGTPANLAKSLLDMMEQTSLTAPKS